MDDSNNGFCRVGEVGPWDCGRDEISMGGGPAFCPNIAVSAAEGPWRVSLRLSNQFLEKWELSSESSLALVTPLVIPALESIIVVTSMVKSSTDC